MTIKKISDNGNASVVVNKPGISNVSFSYDVAKTFNKGEFKKAYAARLFNHVDQVYEELQEIKKADKSANESPAVSKSEKTEGSK